MYGLPFAEQQSLYEQMRELQLSTLTVNDRPYASNTESRYATINHKFVPGYLCPSDGQGGKVAQGNFSGYSSNAAWLFKTNYLPFLTGWQDQHRSYDIGGYADGEYLTALGLTRGAQFSEILDGLSNTIVMGEYLTGLDSTSLFGWPYTCRAGSQHIFPVQSPNSSVRDLLLNYVQLCSAEVSKGYPCTTNPDNNYVTATTRSWHPGGVNVLNGDASVRFLSNITEVNAFKAMVYMANGSQTVFQP